MAALSLPCWMKRLGVPIWWVHSRVSCSTARLEVRYRKNVPLNQPLLLVGRLGESKRRTATATSAIYDAEQNLLAEADAVLVDIPQQVLDGIDVEALGSRVYPAETDLVEGDS